MHPLRNGSQATVRPQIKPFNGLPGWFTESGVNNVPSFPGADWFNHVIAEFQNALTELGVIFDPTKEDHLKKCFSNLISSINNNQNSILDLENQLGDLNVLSTIEITAIIESIY